MKSIHWCQTVYKQLTSSKTIYFSTYRYSNKILFQNWNAFYSVKCKLILKYFVLMIDPVRPVMVLKRLDCQQSNTSLSTSQGIWIGTPWSASLQNSRHFWSVDWGCTPMTGVQSGSLSGVQCGTPRAYTPCAGVAKMWGSFISHSGNRSSLKQIFVFVISSTCPIEVSFELKPEWNLDWT